MSGCVPNKTRKNLQNICGKMFLLLNIKLTTALQSKYVLIFFKVFDAVIKSAIT